MQSRYPILLAIVTLLALGTACSILAPAATPLPVFPTATAPSASPTAAATNTLAPAPTPGTPTVPPLPPTSAPVAPPSASNAQPQRINFPPGGTSATLQGTLAPNGIAHYVLRALAGQTMTVNFAASAAPVNMAIRGADGTVLVSSSALVPFWSGQLLATQDYYIDAVSYAPVPATFTLQVAIQPLGVTPVTDQPRRITFVSGATSAATQGTTATPGADRFVIRALAGQTMTASIIATQGPVILIIYGADGNVLISDHASASTWSGVLPTTQDYFIDTRSVGNAVVPFTLTVTIPPLATVPPVIPKHILFPPGGTSVTVQGSLPVNGMDRWVLRALIGQTMTVNTVTTQGQVILIIFGVEDGDVLISDHAGATSWTGQLPATEDYYIDVRSVGNVAANYSLQVTIPPP